jgi:hypothetical protein
MSKTGGINASLRNELHSGQAVSSQPKPNDAFVELHDFLFGNGETLASLKLHYLTLGTPRREWRHRRRSSAASRHPGFPNINLLKWGTD